MFFWFHMRGKLLFTWLLSGFEQSFQMRENLDDAAQLPVDLYVLDPCRTVAHHTAISCSGASTGSNQHTVTLDCWVGHQRWTHGISVHILHYLHSTCSHIPRHTGSFINSELEKR